MKAPSTRTFGPNDFFGAAWRGHGSVRSLFDQPLRTFRVAFEGVPAQDEDGFVLDEHVTYDHGARLHRRWIISREGADYVGLEPDQGGRMRVRTVPEGVRLIYDRPRALKGPNVTSLRLTAGWDRRGRLAMRGWTSMFGIVPLLRTQVVLEAAQAGSASREVEG